MGRNLDKIKRLEKEIGRYQKKVEDLARENEKLHQELIQVYDGNDQMHRELDADLAQVAIACGKAVIATIRALTKNDPLTLEELREMDLNSPPIWDSCLNEWCAVRWITSGTYQGVSYIGGGNRQLQEGRFYRRKPEEAGTWP